MTRRYTDAEVLEEIRRVSAQVGGPLSRPSYLRHGRIHASTINTRFGSWLKALAAAGVSSPYRYGGIWRDCPVCGTAFRTDNGAKSRRTCSPACGQESKRRKVSKGDGASPQAARGRAATVVELRPCDRCGEDGTSRRLERHHKDRNPYNNDPANLEVLCVLCHKAEHRGEPRRRRRRAP